MPTGVPIPEDVREMLVEGLAELIALEAKKFELKAFVRKSLLGTQHESVCNVTIERLISEARALLLVEAGRSRDDERRMAIATYRAIIADPTSNAQARIKARERIDSLLGLDDRGASSDTAEETAAKIREELARQDGMVA